MQNRIVFKNYCLFFQNKNYSSKASNMGLFTKKPISKLIAEAADSEKGLKRTLSAGNLIALGVGGIIGAGLFVRTAAAAAQNAGPSVTLGFVVAAIGCAL